MRWETFSYNLVNQAGAAHGNPFSDPLPPGGYDANRFGESRGQPSPPRASLLDTRGIWPSHHGIAQPENPKKCSTFPSGCTGSVGMGISDSVILAVAGDDRDGDGAQQEPCRRRNSAVSVFAGGGGVRSPTICLLKLQPIWTGTTNSGKTRSGYNPTTLG